MHNCKLEELLPFNPPCPLQKSISQQKKHSNDDGWTRQGPHYFLEKLPQYVLVLLLSINKDSRHYSSSMSQVRTCILKTIRKSHVQICQVLCVCCLMVPWNENICSSPKDKNNSNITSMICQKSESTSKGEKRQSCWDRANLES